MTHTKPCITGKDIGVKDNTCSIKYVSNKNLVSYAERNIIKIPDFQREIQTDKLDEIYEEFMNKHKLGENYFIHHGYSLNLCQLKGKNECYIIDGQHRFNVLRRLYSEGYIIQVLVRVQICNSLNEMKRDFKLLNSNSDIPLIYKSFEKIFISDMILDVKKYLKENYNSAFNKSKTSSTCNRLHIDCFISLLNPEMVSHLYSIREADVGDPFVLIGEIERINSLVSQLFSEESIKYYVKQSDQKYVQGCQFYLNLKNVSWVHCLFSDMKPTASAIYYKKKKIPKSLGNQVIMQHFGNEYVGKCFVCQTEVNRDSVHLGHVISEYNGGQTRSDNLKCICQSCNSSMGVMNLLEFKEMYFGENS